MAGRIHGFLGGVLFTASLTYLSSVRFQQNRKTIVAALQDSRDLLENGQPVEYLPNLKHYKTRLGVQETVKDIWNEEVIRAVNWIYSIGWYEIGEGIASKLNI